MRNSILKIAAFSAYGALVLGKTTEYPSQGQLPQCSSEASTPCKCPDGTQYLECVTVGVIGANAFDVESIVNDCTSLGTSPIR